MMIFTHWSAQRPNRLTETKLAHSARSPGTVESTDFGSFASVDIPRFWGISMRSDLSTSAGLAMPSNLRRSEQLCSHLAGPLPQARPVLDASV